MSIKLKLYAGFGVMMVFLLGIGIAIANYISLSKQNYEMLSQKVAGATHLANAERGLWQLRWGVAQAVGVPEDGPKIAAESGKWNKQVQDELALFLATKLSAEEQAAATKLREAFTKYADARVKWFELYNAGKTAEAKEWRAVTTTPFGGATNKAFADLLEIEKVAVAKTTREIEQTSDAVRNVVLASVGIALLLGAGLILFLPRTITVPLSEAVAIAKRVAAGDLTSRFGAPRKDETGELLGALQAMNENLVRIVADVRSGAEQVSVATDQLTSTSGEVASRSERQSQATESTAAAVEQMTVAIESVAKSALEVRELSRTGLEGTRDGQAKTVQLLGAIENIQRTITGVAEAMDKFVVSTTKINNMTKQVQEISNQTNLLALNAAIEAARAGEQGRGFAVVADEVRKLAEKSRESAVEIDTTIQEISGQTTELVEAIDTGVKSLSASREYVDSVTASITKTSAVVEQAAVGVDGITLSVNEQTMASQQIARNVENISTMVQETNAAVSDSAKATNLLRDLAGTLVGSVRVFKLA